MYAVDGLSPSEVLIGESTMREKLGIDIEGLLQLRCRARVVVETREPATAESESIADEADTVMQLRRIVVSEEPNDEPDQLPATAQPYDPDEVKTALKAVLEQAQREGLPHAEVESLREALLGPLFDVFRVAPANDPPADNPPIHIEMDASIKGMKNQQPRVFTPDERRFMETKLAQMVEFGHIAECGAAKWVSPAFPVMKPGATPDTPLMSRYRLVVNYRRPNQHTTEVHFPLIKLETLLSVVAGAKYFGKLDLSDGYFQLALDAESQEYYVFQAGPRLYKPLRLVPGSRNAAACFQAAMVAALGDYVNKICVVYMDDVLVFGKTAAEFTQNWKLVLQRLHEHKLKVSAKKTTLYARELKYCGRILTPEGAKFDPQYIDTVLGMGKPHTLGELRSYLATANWLRAGIPRFAEVVEPLQEVLTAALRYARLHRVRQPKNLPLSTGGWGPLADAAFEHIGVSIAHTVTLAFPDDAKVNCVWTDASDKHWAGIVTQTEESELDKPPAEQTHFPLAVLSGSFRDSSLRWSTTEKEGMLWLPQLSAPSISSVVHTNFMCSLTTTTSRTCLIRVLRDLVLLSQPPIA
jgi:hypothetical protein